MSSHLLWWLTYPINGDVQLAEYGRLGLDTYARFAEYIGMGPSHVLGEVESP